MRQGIQSGCDTGDGICLANQSNQNILHLDNIICLTGKPGDVLSSDPRPNGKDDYYGFME